MPAPVIGAAITGGASLVGALLSKPKTQTQQPLYTPQQQQLQTALYGKVSDRLANPSVNLDPLKVAATSTVNRNFGNLQTQLESRLAARGFGSSGKLVTNSKNLDIARQGQLGSLESQFAQLQLGENQRSIDDAQQFAFSRPGTETTTSGNVVGGAVAGGTETAALLYALNHFLSGAPGGGGGGVNPTYAAQDLGGYNGAGPQLP